MSSNVIPEGPKFQLVDARELGRSYMLPDGFRATTLPEWRLARFSVVLPVHNGVSWNDAAAGGYFDFCGAGVAPSEMGEWRYGRDKGIRGIENPVWEDGAFVKSAARKNPYFMSFYNKTHSRYSNIYDSIGGPAVDVDVAGRGIGQEESYEVGQWTTAEKRLAGTGVRAHRFEFHGGQAQRGSTVFELVNWSKEWWPSERDDPERTMLQRAETGPSTLRLESFDVLQFADLRFHDFNAPGTPMRTHRSQFIVLNIAAENLASATLAQLNNALARPRGFVDVYTGDGTEQGGESTATLVPLEHFADLAVREIDRAVGRAYPSMVVSQGGSLTAPVEDGGRHFVGPWFHKLSLPTRVAIAIPNVCQPEEGAEYRQYESCAGIAGPRIFANPAIGASWRWHEQWAWLLSTGADAWAEVIPEQSQTQLDRLAVGDLSTWSILSSPSGLGMVRACSASDAGGRYWALGSTRFVDLLVLQVRAQEAFSELMVALQDSGKGIKTTTADFEAASLDHKYEMMRADLEKLEELQLDHIVARDRLWFKTIDSRPNDTAVMRALQDSFGVAELFGEFETELGLRQSLLRSQYEGLLVEKNRVEEQRRGAEAAEREVESRREKRRGDIMNLFLAVTAAGLVGPDWAAAYAEGDFGAAFVGFAIIAALVGVPLYLLNRAR